MNQTKNGYVVLLMNNRGVDKTQNGVERVDRRQAVEVSVRCVSAKTAKELTGPSDLPLSKAESGPEVRVRVHPGDVQVIEFIR